MHWQQEKEKKSKTSSMGLFFGILHDTITLRPVLSSGKQLIWFEFNPTKEKKSNEMLVKLKKKT